MSSLSSISSREASLLIPESGLVSAFTEAASDRVAAVAKESIAAVSSFAVGAVASIKLCAETRSMLDYKELTRRIPKEHLGLIESRMCELSADPAKLGHALANINARLVDGAYHSLPENYYFYGLIGVQVGSLSVEQFTILVDYLTLTAQGVKPDVVPLFFMNEKGDKVLNHTLADSILCSLNNHMKFESREAGYDFLEATFKDLPPEALQVQVYDPTWHPGMQVSLPEGCDAESYEVKLIKHHDVPVVAKLYQCGFRVLTYFKQGIKWKRLSVTTCLYQHFLDQIFKIHAVRIHPVLGSSSLDDLRDNGRTSTRDQGMFYVTPAANEKGYDLQSYKYADSYPVVDLDYRDHDRYHAWVCSSLPKDLIRQPLMRIADFLTHIAKIASYLREKDAEKKKIKGQNLSAEDRELANDLQRGASKEAVIAKFDLPPRALKILECLLNDVSGDSDLRALRHISWRLVDMEFNVTSPESCFAETMGLEQQLVFSLSLIECVFESRRYDISGKLELLQSCYTPAAERAKKIIKERLVFPEFASVRARYEVEMLIYEGGFLPEETKHFIREIIHGKNEEPSYEDWLLFRGLFDDDTYAYFEAMELLVEDEMVSFLQAQAPTTAAAAGAGAREPTTT